MGRPAKSESWYSIDVRLKRLWFLFDNETICKVLKLHKTQLYRRASALELPMRDTVAFKAEALARAIKISGPAPKITPQRAYEIRAAKMRKLWRSDPELRRKWQSGLEKCRDWRSIHWNDGLDEALAAMRAEGKTWLEIASVMGINDRSCRRRGMEIGLPRYIARHKRSAAKVAPEVGHPSNTAALAAASVPDVSPPKTGGSALNEPGAASFEEAA